LRFFQSLGWRCEHLPVLGGVGVDIDVSRPYRFSISISTFDTLSEPP
jgi:hypothetical protein